MRLFFRYRYPQLQQYRARHKLPVSLYLESESAVYILCVQYSLELPDSKENPEKYVPPQIHCAPAKSPYL